MSFGRDERAVSVVVGAVLMLGIAVAALAMYQANVVPEQNADAEIEHHRAVRGDLISLTDRMTMASHGTPMSQSVRMGPSYQERLFAINSPPPQSTIATGEPREITIENGGESHTIVTRDVRFTTSYNYYHDAPVVVNDLGAVYHDAGDRTVGLADTTLVADDTVHLLVVQGNYTLSSASAESLRVVPVETETFSLDGETNVTIETPYEGFDGSLPDDVDRSYADGNFSFSGEFDAIRISVVSLDLDEDDGGIGDAPFDADGGDGGGGDGGGESGDGDPSFGSLEVRDESRDTPRGQNGDVAYDVVYAVDDPDGTFDRVEASFDNGDNPGLPGTESSPATSDTLTHDPGSRDADFGDAYTITVRLFGADGEVTEERCEVTDTADGAGPTVDC